MTVRKGQNLTPAAAGQSGDAANAWALLHELESMVAALLRGGRGASIDLRRVPMTPADRAVLDRVLGQGELSARLEVFGASRVRETAVHGVWWVTHSNEQDEVVAEFLEVSFCPELLFSHREDVEAALDKLRTRLTDHRGPDPVGPGR